MNKSFAELKQQLNELSETINKFESEAVQLRIVELLFNQSGLRGLAEEHATFEGAPKREAKSQQVAAAPAGALGGRSQSRASGRRSSDTTAPSASGAVAALARLVESDFFNEKRTIGDVVRKCEEDFGVRYKSNAFSGPLSRYAASGVLKREKNEEGKFAYYK